MCKDTDPGFFMVIAPWEKLGVNVSEICNDRLGLDGGWKTLISAAPPAPADHEVAPS
jgi:hypothetical protein